MTVICFNYVYEIHDVVVFRSVIITLSRSEMITSQEAVTELGYSSPGSICPHSFY